MSQLNNLFVSSSYQGLLKLTDSTNGLTNTLQYVQDGSGNNGPLQMSLTSMNLTGSIFINNIPVTGTTSGTSGTSGSSGSSGSDGTSGTSGSSGDGFSVKGAWTGTTTYVINDVVLYGGQSYASIQNGNLNKQPSVQPAWWTLFSAAGSSGTSGTSGSNGTNGSSGTSGTNGTSGSNGTNGSSGSNGTNGSSGTSGSNGTNGSSGTSGGTGSSGTSGSNGSDGSSGTSGSNGTDGSSGTSGSNGTDGSSGTSGSNGTDGSSGTSGTSFQSPYTGNIVVTGSIDITGQYLVNGVPVSGSGGGDRNGLITTGSIGTSQFISGTLVLTNSGSNNLEITNPVTNKGFSFSSTQYDNGRTFGGISSNVIDFTIGSNGNIVFNNKDNGAGSGSYSFESNGPILYSSSYVDIKSNTLITGSLRVTGSVIVTGSITGSNDILINSIRFGRGGGNALTNLAIGSSALNNNVVGITNIAIGLNSLSGSISGSNNIGIGNNTLSVLSGSSAQSQQNVIIGHNSGTGLISGERNTIVGHQAGTGNNINRNTGLGRGVFVGLGSSAIPGFGSGSQYNVAVGHNAGFSFNSGSQNVFINGGTNGGEGLRSGSNNTVVGATALPVEMNNSTIIGLISSAATIGTSPVTNSVVIADGQGNVMIRKDGSTGTVKFPTSVQITGSLSVNGAQSITGSLQVSGNINNLKIWTGSLNTNSIGIGDTLNSQTGSSLNNIAIGGGALSTNVTGANIVAIGNDALRNSVQGFNTAIGGSALTALILGESNMAIGQSAIQALTGGTKNTAIGFNTMVNVVSGSNNTAIGAGTLQRNTNGEGCVVIGNQAGSWSTNSNEFFVGNDNYGNQINEQSSSIFYGKFNSTTANQTLQINAQTDIRNNLVVSGSLTVGGNLQFNVGDFYSTQTQTLAAGVSGSVTYNNTGTTYGVSLVSSSQLTIANAGVYSITFSAQIKGDGGQDTVYIWLKKNGTNVADTATKIVAKNNEEDVMTVEYIVQASASDYYELAWQNTTGDGDLVYYAASGNIPAIPSIITSVKQVR